MPGFNSTKSVTDQVLEPTLFSGLATALVACLVMFVQYFSKFGSYSLYGYVFGTDSSIALIQSADSSIKAVTDTVFGNTDLNKVLFFGFWMLVGLCIYVILSSFIKGYEEISDFIHEWGYVHALRKRLAENVLTRIAARAVIAIIGFFFILLFLRFLLPLARLCTIVAGGQLTSLNGILYALLAFSILWLSLHVQVVLLRLFFLRVRLWGTADPAGSSWHA
jgi:hypothetical protein